MIKGHLDLLLMGVLRHGPQHGYAVITSLQQRSDGAFDLPEGSIYPALHKLELRGLVSSEWSMTDGRRRRVYGLTPKGRTALTEQRQEWRRFARSVVAVVGA